MYSSEESSSRAATVADAEELPVEGAEGLKGNEVDDEADPTAVDVAAKTPVLGDIGDEVPYGEETEAAA